MWDTTLANMVRGAGDFQQYGSWPEWEKIDLDR